MPKYEYLIIITAPDELDADTAEEIAEASTSNDQDEDGGVRRWLGDKVNRAEDALDEQLPEGWTASIREGI
jgi:hypothetical protein